MSSPKVTIRNVREEELTKVLELTMQVKWNNPLKYLTVVHRSSSSGWFGAFTDDGELISTCSSIKVADDLGFISTYVTKEEYRGKGFGKPVFDRCMSFLGNINVCLNAAEGKADLYAKSGFKFRPFVIDTYWSPMMKPDMFTKDPCISIKDISTIDLDIIETYDKQVYPDRKQGFLREWLKISCEALAAFKNGKVVGYAFTQEGVTGYRIMPMYADNMSVAENLLARVADIVPSSEKVEVVAPSTNPLAADLFKRFGFEYFGFNTRMFTKQEVVLDTDKVFAVTNYENMLI